MKAERSASQILFGYLPEQTVDVERGIWKVKKWVNPIVERNIDLSTLRRELCRLAAPWRVEGTDGGFVSDLERKTDLVVWSLNRDNGVELEPFPQLWICKCGRIHTVPDKQCSCGHRGLKGQLHFVGYHDACGRLKQPSIPRCKEHNDVRISFPGTANAAEIRFSCPTCGKELQRGFGFSKCECGQGNLTFNVHRAASVYTPRSVVIVNPPSPEKIRSLQEAGGASRTLAWVVEGMKTATAQSMGLTREALRKQLLAQQLTPKVVEQMLRSAEEAGELQSKGEEFNIPDDRVSEAEEQAVIIALATSQSRTRIDDLVAGSDSLTELGKLYREKYSQSLETAGLEAIDLIEKFPVLTGHYGYTRGSFKPGESRLRAFRDRAGMYIVYGDVAETEALLVRLAPTKVADWLVAKGFDIGEYNDSRTARLAILRHAIVPEAADDPKIETVGSTLLTLVHSYAHRFVRSISVHAGIERSALAELLVPLHLGFFVYAAARGDFVLGGLQAVFEGELDKLLHNVVNDEYRCALDPGCAKTGGACVACLHLGEPSCRYFNRFLSRSCLFKDKGYMTR